MASKMGFAVVGLGMGKHHCHSINKAEDSSLIAVCDVDEERLKPVAEEFGCKAYTSYAELLQDDEVQAVNVCTPSGMHAEMGIEAAAAGKHVIVEKPADVTTSRIDDLIAAGEKYGVKIACIFQSRLQPLNQRIKQAIDEGRLGKLIGVHGHLPWFRAATYYEGPHGEWKGSWAMDGGGSLMNQGVHTVDLLQWFGGGVEAAVGSFAVFNHDIESEDQTVAILKYKSGAVGSLYSTTCAYPGHPQQITIYGTKGTIIKTASELLAWKILGDEEGKEEAEMMGFYGSNERREEAISNDPMAVSADGHTLIVQDLIEAVAEDRDPVIDLRSARNAVAAINAVFESSRTGAWETVK